MRKDLMSYPFGRDFFNKAFTEKVLEHAMWYLEGGWETEGRRFPSLEGLAMSLGVCRQQVYSWRRQSATLDKICDEIKSRATVIISDRAIDGTYNSGISKFMLMQIAGYRDNISTDVTTQGQAINTNTPSIVFDASTLSNDVLRELTDAIAKQYSADATRDIEGPHPSDRDGSLPAEVV